MILLPPPCVSILTIFHFISFQLTQLSSVYKHKQKNLSCSSLFFDPNTYFLNLHKKHYLPTQRLFFYFHDLKTMFILLVFSSIVWFLLLLKLFFFCTDFADVDALTWKFSFLWRLGLSNYDKAFILRGLNP